MIEFKIVKKSKKSKARVGILKTENSEIETPAFVAVATLANVKTLDSFDLEKTKTQIIIANTFHLHLKPGEKVVKNCGGLHNFMNFKKPIMTDSGGFQVFSLGFGKDFGIGKVLKFFPGKDLALIKETTQPKEVKINDDGVWFFSPVDGKKLFLGPKESIRIQEKLGADIIFAFDECTPPNSSYQYIKKALERTHLWAKKCLEVKKSNQAIFGIVQGSKFRRLRELSAKYINSLGFDGYGIGGDLGTSKTDMENILKWSIPFLDERKPRHLLGIGHLKDIELIIKQGIDLFDCVVPTQYGRRGIAFVSEGKLNLSRSLFLKDKKPLDKKCECYVCQSFSRAYISHLFRAKEITGLKLLTFHNLWFFNSYLEKIREKIKNGKL